MFIHSLYSKIVCRPGPDLSTLCMELWLVWNMSLKHEMWQVMNLETGIKLQWLIFTGLTHNWLSNLVRVGSIILNVCLLIELRATF